MCPAMGMYCVGVVCSVGDIAVAVVNVVVTVVVVVVVIIMCMINVTQPWRW